jgi:hypothetical protein
VFLAGSIEIGTSAEFIGSVVPSVTDICCDGRNALCSVEVDRGISG